MTSDYATCAECGGTWMRLRAGRDDNGRRDGTVVVTRDGRVTGWCGFMQCADCDADVQVPQPDPPRLTLVTEQP